MEKNIPLFLFFMDFFLFYSMHLLIKEATIHFSVNFGQFFVVNVLCSVVLYPQEAACSQGFAMKMERNLPIASKRIKIGRERMKSGFLLPHCLWGLKVFAYLPLVPACFSTRLSNVSLNELISAPPWHHPDSLAILWLFHFLPQMNAAGLYCFHCCFISIYF